MHIYTMKAIEALYGDVHKIKHKTWWVVWSAFDVFMETCSVEWDEWPRNTHELGPTVL